MMLLEIETATKETKDFGLRQAIVNSHAALAIRLPLQHFRALICGFNESGKVVGIETGAPFADLDDELDLRTNAPFGLEITHRMVEEFERKVHLCSVLVWPPGWTHTATTRVEGNVLHSIPSWTDTAFWADETGKHGSFDDAPMDRCH